MKATYIEYNEEGKTLLKKSVDVSFASSDKTPSIWVELGYKKKRYSAVHFSTSEIIKLIFKRMFDNGKRCEEHRHDPEIHNFPDPL